MITLKTAEEIKIMRLGGQHLAAILAELKKAVKPGLTTKELDSLAQNYWPTLAIRHLF